MRKLHKWFMLIASVFGATGLVACGYQASADDPQTEGGPNSKIRADYVFETYGQFSNFYEQFKVNNPQRYLVPHDDNPNLSFEYRLVAEGVPLPDYESQRYDIVLPFPTMYLDISYGQIEVKGKCFDVSSLLGSVPFELKYRVDKVDEIHIFTDANEDVYIASIENVNPIEENEVCEIILSEFKKGTF